MEAHAQFLMQANGAREQTNAAWHEVEGKLKDEILLRHYSPKTLQAYTGWLRKFQRVVGNADPAEVTGAEAKRFLADLAVRRQVSASAQNQAFNALLFLFRHALAKELGDLSDIPRAKSSKSIPTILSRWEVEELLADAEQVLARACHGPAEQAGGFPGESAVEPARPRGDRSSEQRLQWIRDPVFMLATLSPHVRRTYGVEPRACRIVRPVERAGRVRFELSGVRDGCSWRVSLDGEVRMRSGGRGAMARIEAARIGPAGTERGIDRHTPRRHLPRGSDSASSSSVGAWPFACRVAGDKGGVHEGIGHRDTRAHARRCRSRHTRDMELPAEALRRRHDLRMVVRHALRRHLCAARSRRGVVDAAGARLGRLRSEQPEEPAAADLAAGRAVGGAARTVPGPGRGRGRRPRRSMTECRCLVCARPGWRRHRCR